jgi:hypothetical protein
MATPQVYDYFTVFDDDGTTWCNSGSDKNAQCTTKETVDGTSCTATYTGDNAGWNGQGLVGTFTSHDKGTFLLNGGTIEGPALGAVDVTQDTRCEPWKCTSAGFGFTSSAGGFRCVFDY